MYRQNYGMFVSTVTFFNHESERRTDNYVTRKITKSAARISKGLQDQLVLGDLSAMIDWGYAKEYMEAAWNILQLDKPDDFVIGTGELNSVQDFVNETFNYLNLDVEKYVSSSNSLMRPVKNLPLVADTTKANEMFGFDPKIKMKELIKIMVDNDLQMKK